MKDSPQLPIVTPLFFACAIAAVLGFAVGCSSGTSTVIPNGDGGATDRTADAAVDAQNGSSGLKILSLTATVPGVTGGTPNGTETAAVTFVAIVTDPLGLESVAGGQLLDDAGHTYGAFGAGSNKGTFAVTVDFAAMNTVRAIDFGGPKSERTFVAKFFDNEGAEATKSLTLGLSCRSPSLGLVGACRGECIDDSGDGRNCGACGKACESGLVCEKRACGIVPAGVGTATKCLPSSATAPLASCQTICEAAGRSCPSGAYGLRAYGATDPTCQIAPSGVGACTRVIDSPFFTCSCK